MQASIFPLPMLFFAVGGIHYGVSADQVGSMASLDQAGQDRPLWFHQEMGYDFEPPYRRPTALRVRTTRGGLFTVIVDDLEDMAEVLAEDIRPMPPLAAPHARGRGLWGVIPRGERLYLLVDFALWPRRKAA